MNKNDCIKSYRITRGTSPWRGLTATREMEDASEKIVALDLKGSDYKAIPSLEKYARDGNIIMGRNDKLRRIAVDSLFFSDLVRADATAAANGRSFIGTCKEAWFKVFTPAELADFLIESQIVHTFRHVESEFCLDSESETDDFYHAHYKGKHVYFTNRRNEEGLDFSIFIDKKTGSMFLEAE